MILLHVHQMEELFASMVGTVAVIKKICLKPLIMCLSMFVCRVTLVLILS